MAVHKRTILYICWVGPKNNIFREIVINIDFSVIPALAERLLTMVQTDWYFMQKINTKWLPS